MIKTHSPVFYPLTLALLLAAPAMGAEPPAPPVASQAEPAPPVASQTEPAAAPDTPANGKAAPEVSLVDMVKAMSAFLTEEETQLVYDYLWDSSIAALKGEEEEIILPPEVAFKLAILQKRIVKEGGFYLEGLARKMEEDLARYWRDRVLTPPPPVPYSLPSERNNQVR
jgi:hypothetical protein